MTLGHEDYFINFAGIYVDIGGNVNGTGIGFDVYLCPTDTSTSSPNYGMNSNIPYAAGTLINPANTAITYKIAVDLYTLMMMYEVAVAYPSLPVVNTYTSAGVLITDKSDAGNRVKTGVSESTYGYTTMRPWQAMEAWSWAAGAHAGTNLSSVGYTSALPYRRIQ